MNMRFLKSEWTRLIRDESGQTTAEYIFLLVMVVMAVRLLGKNLRDKLEGLMDIAFGKMNEEVQGM